MDCARVVKKVAAGSRHQWGSSNLDLRNKIQIVESERTLWLEKHVKRKKNSSKLN
jgi:hypothetical protein